MAGSEYSAHRGLCRSAGCGCSYIAGISKPNSEYHGRAELDGYTADRISLSIDAGESIGSFRPRTPPEIDGNVLMTNGRLFGNRVCAERGTRYEAIAVELTDRDNRDSQREAVLRVIVPLLTALPKA